uniref:Sister chromatid cohesion protein DCC1 n=1 Tax=Heterorhabditis bacteriophora TaxID=37862 RepID=A0A1I7XV04_HETBA
MIKSRHYLTFQYALASKSAYCLVDKNRDVGLDMIGDMKDNIENVKKIFNLVRELDNVKGELQQLQFSEKFPENEYRLIEVDNKLADEFENGQKLDLSTNLKVHVFILKIVHLYEIPHIQYLRLVFRGMLDDCAVLCTETRSYSAKEVETSNTMLLVPFLNTDDSVLDPVEKCLEIRKVVVITHSSRVV